MISSNRWAACSPEEKAESSGLRMVAMNSRPHKLAAVGSRRQRPTSPTTTATCAQGRAQASLGLPLVTTVARDAHITDVIKLHTPGRDGRDLDSRDGFVWNCH